MLRKRNPPLPGGSSALCRLPAPCSWTLPLWPVYSTVMSLVMLRAIVLELRGAENRWNKLERTGVVSVGGDHRAKPGG